jgi:hypothetical protein
MKFLKHIISQPFIAATGAAALLHSTWALATLFAGQQPESALHLIGWLIPALLIAFALDVGQIATSAEIREHGLTLARAVTFVVFSAATYYLQWLYIAHHMPALELAAGISAIAQPTALSMRDAALWVIPALLPLSTLLYTFSGGKAHATKAEPKTPAEQPAPLPAIEVPALPAGDAEPLPFGIAVLELDAAESTPATPKNRRPIASANGNGSKPAALRNKEI